METLLKKLDLIEEEYAKEFEEVSTFIYDHPELGDEEWISSQYLVDKIKGHGFEVEYPYKGIPTAFRAEFKNGTGPKVAFLAEYDALPGYGENQDENGHACGHNWIAASCYGACVVLAKLKDEFQGSIILMGTPAEETVGRKVDLVNLGAFDDIDMAFQIHLSTDNKVNARFLAMDSIEFDFAGVPAHSAAFPEKGINALDAVNLTYAGINALRQHVRSDVRIHGIITNGGQAANIVPQRATCQFYIRAADRTYLNEVTEKVINCAKGAALMTGATLSYRNYENSFDDLKRNVRLSERLKAQLQRVGVEEWADGDTQVIGSSDVGNVSYVAATAYAEMLITDGQVDGAHTEEFLRLANSEAAMDKLHKAIKAMAATALEGLKDPQLFQENEV